MKEKRQFNLTGRFKSISSAIIVYTMILVIAALTGFAVISLNYNYTTAVDSAISYTGSITSR